MKTHHHQNAPLVDARGGTARGHALIVGVTAEERRTITTLLAGEYIVPVTVDGVESAIEALSNPFDIVVSDVALEGRSEVVRLGRWILQHHPEVPIILFADTFPWIPAASPVAAVPLLMRSLNLTAFMEKVRDAVQRLETRDVA